LLRKIGGRWRFGERRGGEEEEKGEEMKWGWLRFFFFGATIIFLIFQARKEKNGAKPTTSLRLHVTSRTTTSKGKARQGKARQGTIRYEEETRGGGNGRTRPEKHHLAKGNGTKPNHRKVRQGKGQKEKGNCIKPPRGVANS
jgi:hypothetical protein